MKQLNAMGNRRHYYRNAAAAANRVQGANTPTNNGIQQAPENMGNLAQARANPQQQPPPQPPQQQQQQQMNLQHSLANRGDQYDMEMMHGSIGQPGMNPGYMHQGKVPYNMYLF